MPYRSFTHYPSENRAYKNLSPKTRLGVGLAVIAWGAAGLYLSDRAEETFGYTPTEEDKKTLRKYTPHIVAVEKNEAVDQQPPSKWKLGILVDSTGGCQ
ncbi:hypothetical protein HJFPF1_00680 [Paramyrothecium foliicola]|nr:hypothetical protein HJFPF1_00680 [Paramyrothecium foliicola]